MSKVIIKGLETDEEQDIANDLMAKVHFPGYYTAYSEMGAFLSNYPEFRREHTRLLMAEGQIVACLCIFTHTIRLGEARMKTGGIGNVATAGPWRRKGYAALLMEDALRYMRSHGYHLSMLFGIADFYHRWGFTSVLPEYASLIELKEADTATSESFKHRAIKPGDIPAVLKMHTLTDRESACSLIRSSGHFSNNWKRWKQARILTNDQGRVMAYFLGHPVGGEYHVDEMGAVERSWLPSLLRACVIRARGECASRIRFNAPPSHPFVQFLMQYRADHEMHTYRNSNGMMAVVNIEETLESMTAEWESLLRVSPAADLAASFTLVIDRVPYRVRAHHGAVDIARNPGPDKVSLSALEFMQLLTGYRHLDDLLCARRRSLSASAITLLRILFPKRTPYVWLADRF